LPGERGVARVAHQGVQAKAKRCEAENYACITLASPNML
jgi:hypothetical protein